jgi:hypothetical protein
VDCYLSRIGALYVGTTIAMTDAEIADGWIAEISENDGVVDPNRNMEISFVLDDCIYSDPVREFQRRSAYYLRFPTWNLPRGPNSAAQS